jgi:hypothetical protein
MHTFNPVLLSIESAANLEPAGGAMERVTDDNIGLIISDARTQDVAAAAPQAVQPVEAQQPAETQPASPTEQRPTAEQPQAEQPASPPDATQEAVSTAPESVFAPIFDLVTLPPEQAVPQAVDVMRNLHATDPLTYRLLASAVLQASPKTAAEFALKANGIPSEKVLEFSAWLANGGDKLPEPVEFPAFDQTIVKLDAAKGYMEDEQNQWVRLASGLELNLADPRDKSHLELEKRLYDADVKDKQDARTTAERTRQEEDQRKQAEAQQAQQDFAARVDFYMEDRRSLVNSMLSETINALAPEDKMRGLMLQATVTNLLESQDAGLLALFKQTDPQTAAALESISALGNKVAAYVREGAGFEKSPDGKWQMVGRAKELAEQQARVIRTAVNAIRDTFNKDILRTNRAELAATSTEPKIPQGVESLTSNAPNQPPDFSNLNTLDDLIRAGREHDRQVAAGRN